MNISDKALELIIRDVLGGMAELAIGESYRNPPDCMEVLGVEAADPLTAPLPTTPQEAVILPFPGLSKTA